MSGLETLAARQQALLAALTEGTAVDGLLAPAGIGGGLARGLQAYRQNARALSARALGAVYPALREALGEDSFDALARTLWRRRPPQHGDLAQWGGALADFLAAQAGMDPALCDLARLEWARHLAERAADAVLDGGTLQLLIDEPPERLGLRLRPGLVVLGQSYGPLLVWREGWRAAQGPLSAGAAALMQALLDGVDLAGALARATAVEPDFDFSAWLQRALREAWLQAAFIREQAA
ncbi:HvfC/BufC N-terminal domain-containing protein [Roseateles violae]|uniref:DNA-binding domain-containing protein n=1 Tax=Roseateles violae TaxID=3058042 RepID=A0ABT8DQB2_9BURK|nr:DNA-binding domain-containing protein [Pelomonas sp. PFR6]MDN3920544.1 DNA-binding domain-containing protein [Pelomonas sp. PFR6]